MFWIFIGIAAASLTTFSLLPQIIRVVRTKKAHDISPIMLFQFTLGVMLWAAYGFYRQDPVIIVANLVTLATLLVLIVLFFKYGRVSP